jgi:CMP-2-keto-3-deoxyoctulosonic acid synthetase
LLQIKIGSDKITFAERMNSNKRHENYRTFGKYTFAEADAELRAYWHSRTPQERMEELEKLRIMNYGEEAINARIPRIFGVSKPRRS